jgi:hypothetical protein
MIPRYETRAYPVRIKETLRLIRAACALSAMFAFSDCGNSIFLSPLPQLDPYAPLKPGHSAILYGQIQNQKRDNHIVIGNKGSALKGDHLLGDSTGLFAIMLAPGAYELRLDGVGDDVGPVVCVSTAMMGCPTVDYAFPVPFNAKKHALLALKIDPGRIYYVGSFFLTKTSIEVNWEKGEADSLMGIKYRGFNPALAIENYPSRDSL